MYKYAVRRLKMADFRINIQFYCINMQSEFFIFPFSVCFENSMCKQECVFNIFLIAKSVNIKSKRQIASFQRFFVGYKFLKKSVAI